MKLILEHLDELAKGALITLAIFACSLVIATVGGLVIGALRLTRIKIVRAAAWLYVEFFRGVSVIALLFWAFYVLPTFGLSMTAFVTAVVVIGLNQSAFIGEVVRGGIQAVPVGQYEASIAINLSSWQRFRSVILPQALPISIPPYANQVINTLKETAVVSLIGIAELTFVAMDLRMRIGYSIPILVGIAVVYLLLAYLFTKLLSWLENRVRVEPTMKSKAQQQRTWRLRDLLGTGAR